MSYTINDANGVTVASGTPLWGGVNNWATLDITYLFT